MKDVNNRCAGSLRKIRETHQSIMERKETLGNQVLTGLGESCMKLKVEQQKEPEKTGVGPK